MDNKQKFNDEDKKKVTEFLNFIASKAEFKINTNETIKYFQLLSYMQKELLPKINDNILEVTRIIEETKEE